MSGLSRLSRLPRLSRLLRLKPGKSRLPRLKTERNYYIKAESLASEDSEAWKVPTSEAFQAFFAYSPISEAISPFLVVVDQPCN